MAEQALTSAKNTRLRWSWRWLPLLAAGIVFVGVLAFATLQPIKVLPRVRLSPAFALTDQDGDRITNEDMRGRIVLYGFGFSECGATCAEVERAMQDVQSGLGGRAVEDPPVELVMISVDPERDTAEQLRAYSAALGADPARWRIVTGEPDRLKQVVGGGFEVFYGPDDDGALQLEPALILVDGAGLIRREYRVRSPGGLPTAERLLDNIALLTVEARNSDGLTGLAYEAAHIFVCYAP